MSTLGESWRQVLERIEAKWASPTRLQPRFTTKCGGEGGKPGPCPSGGSGRPRKPSKAVQRRALYESMVSRAPKSPDTAPAAAKEGEHFDPAPHLEALAAAVREHGGAHNVAPLAKVRAALAHLPREHQDALIREARKRGLVSGMSAEGRHGISEEDRAAAIHEPNEPHPIGSLSLRNKSETEKCREGVNAGKPGPCPDAGAASTTGAQAKKKQARLAAAGGSQPEAPQSRSLASRLAGAGKGAFRLARKVEHAAMVGFHKVRGAVRAVARERGYSEKTADRVARIVGLVDMVAAWTINPVAGGMLGGLAGMKAGAWTPVFGLAFLALSTATNPRATWRAARAALRGRAGQKGMVTGHTLAASDYGILTLRSGFANDVPPDLVASLLERLSGPRADEFEALLFAALAETEGDLEEALALAEDAFGETPETTAGTTQKSATADAQPAASKPRKPPKPSDPKLGDDLERAEAMADILGGLLGERALLAFAGESPEDEPGASGDGEPGDTAKSYGILTLKAWTETDHPRGKGGRFIPKGSAEAVAAAKVAIGRTLRNAKGTKSPEHAKELSDHLSILTVKQLYDLKKQYGLKASGKLREHLVAKLLDRLPGAQERMDKERKAAALDLGLDRDASLEDVVAEIARKEGYPEHFVTKQELEERLDALGISVPVLRGEAVQTALKMLTEGVPEKAAAKPPKEPEMGKVYNVGTDDLVVDPGRFQYKLNVDKSGVGQELKSVRTWNPDFAGVVSVWRDPADGKTYVVNGHHRRELAGRLGVKDMAVRYVNAPDAQTARGLGALINIAEGRGTAVDAAKFMRDTGTSLEEMEAHGVSLKGKLAADAAVLTHLSDRAFDRLARGTLDETKALAVAKHLADHDLQDQLFGLLEKREDEGKDLSPKVIEEMARQMAETPKTKTTEHTLFGDIESEESLFVPRAEVAAAVRAGLAKEVNDWLAVASKRRAEKVGQAGNKLNIEENRRLADEAERVKNVFDTLAHRKGAISDALNAAAEEYHQAKSKGARDAAKQRALESVRDAVLREAGVGREAEPGAEGGAVPGGGGVAAAEQGAGAAPVPADAGRGGAGAAGLKPPEPGFTGTDPLGRKWVDGELVAAGKEEGEGKPAAAEEAPSGKGGLSSEQQAQRGRAVQYAQDKARRLEERAERSGDPEMRADAADLRRLAGVLGGIEDPAWWEHNSNRSNEELIQEAHAHAEEQEPATVPLRPAAEKKPSLGETKVVGKDGKPRVVFHGGSPDLDVGKMDTRRGETTQYGPGAYFASGRGTAEEWADERGGVVHEATLDIRKPFDDREAIPDTPERQRLADLLLKEGMKREQLERIFSGDIGDPFKVLARGLAKPGDKAFWPGANRLNALLRQAGYDGVIGKLHDGVQYIAFEPDQIRPASAAVEEAPAPAAAAPEHEIIHHPPFGSQPGFEPHREEPEPAAAPAEPASPRVHAAIERYANREQTAQGGGLFGGEDLQAREGFARLPDGAPVVFTGGEFGGKTGRIVHDPDGKGGYRIMAEVEGREGLVPIGPDAIEPLQENLSWRVAGGGAGGPSKQGGLFGGAAPAAAPKEEDLHPDVRAVRGIQRQLNALGQQGEGARGEVEGVPVEPAGVGQFRATIGGKVIHGDLQYVAQRIHEAAGKKPKEGGAESQEEDYGVSEIEGRGPFREGGFVTPHTSGVYPTRREAIAAARAALGEKKPRAPRKPAPENPRAAELRADINAAAREQQASGRIAKLPSDLTQAEFLAKQGAAYGGGERAKEAHRKMVAGAVAKGETVPAEVLADYPDLAKQAAEKAKEAPEEGGYIDLAMSTPSDPNYKGEGHAEAKAKHDAATARIADLEGQIRDWQSRQYKPNASRVQARAGDEHSGETTMGEANERRRQRAISNLQRQLTEARAEQQMMAERLERYAPQTAEKPERPATTTPTPGPAPAAPGGVSEAALASRSPAQAALLQKGLGIARPQPAGPKAARAVRQALGQLPGGKVLGAVLGVEGGTDIHGLPTDADAVRAALDGRFSRKDLQAAADRLSGGFKNQSLREAVRGARAAEENPKNPPQSPSTDVDKPEGGGTIPVGGGEKPTGGQKVDAISKLVRGEPGKQSVAGYIEADGRVPAFAGQQLALEELQALVAAGVLTPVTTPKGKVKRYDVDADKARQAAGAAPTSPPVAPEAPKGRVSRAAAAAHIADALEYAGYTATPWTGGNSHRVYVKDRQGRPLGYLAITHEGTVEAHLDRERGAVMGHVPALDIEPLAKPAAGGRRIEDLDPDDPMDRMEIEQLRNAGRI